MAAVATPARLSVCIPTHHGRCALLEEALESIAAQATPDLALEVVVSDNASRDGTEAMIEHFRARHPQLALVYARNERDVPSKTSCASSSGRPATGAGCSDPTTS